MSITKVRIGLNTRIVNKYKQELGYQLIDALDRKDEVLANKLIDEGADLTVSKSGYTALALACSLPNSDIAIKLLNLGSIVNIPNEQSFLLISSLLNGHSQLAIKLIDAGINVNVEYTDGITPLMIAAYKNMPEIVEKLIVKGADLNAEYTNQRYYLTPFQNNRDTNINTAVLLAISEKHEDIALMLINAGAELDDYFAFLMACKNGSNKVAIKLIDNGVDVNPHDEENVPLFLALNNCSFEVCLKIITSDSLAYLPIYRLGDTFKSLGIPNGLYSPMVCDGLPKCRGPPKPDNINDIRLQKALSFNFPQYPIRYEFTLNDLYLLNSKNRKKVEVLTIARSLTESNFALMPNELLQSILGDIFN